MIRAALFVALAALGADFPAPMNDEDRAKVIEQWQVSYKERVQSIKDRIEDGRLLAKKKGMEIAGKSLIKKSTDNLKTLTKNPSHAKKLKPFVTINAIHKPGIVGHLPAAQYQVVKITPQGTVVHGSYLGSEGSREHVYQTTYLIASPMKAKLREMLPLRDPYYVAGAVDLDGKQVPVLYRFEIKPGEVPK